MQVSGLIQIVVDEPGLTLAEARAKAQNYPEKYKCLFVEDLAFESWDEPLAKTEEDEKEEEE